MIELMAEAFCKVPFPRIKHLFALFIACADRYALWPHSLPHATGEAQAGLYTRLLAVDLHNLRVDEL